MSAADPGRIEPPGHLYDPAEGAPVLERRQAEAWDWGPRTHPDHVEVDAWLDERVAEWRAQVHATVTDTRVQRRILRLPR